MTIKVLYHSVTGNTQQIAEAISDELDCPIVHSNAGPHPIRADVLFIGGACYNEGNLHPIHADLIREIEALNPEHIGTSVVFSTGFPRLSTAIAQICELLEKRGIPVYEKHFFCRGKFMIFNRRRPNQRDLQLSRDFARLAIEQLNRSAVSS